jgi:hypothetical protein
MLLVTLPSVTAKVEAVPARKLVIEVVVEEATELAAELERVRAA